MSGLVAIFALVSQSLGLPPGLLSAVCWVESKHNQDAINLYDGGTPSLGVCQIKLSTARRLGYKGSIQKLWRDPKTNAYYAGLYLRVNLDRYDNDANKAVAAYNAGVHRVNNQGLTKNRKYVEKVLLAWGDHK